MTEIDYHPLNIILNHWRITDQLKFIEIHWTSHSNADQCEHILFVSTAIDRSIVTWPIKKKLFMKWLDVHRVRALNAHQAKLFKSQRDWFALFFASFLFPKFTTLSHEPNMSNLFHRIDYKHFSHILFRMLQNTSTIIDVYAR